MSWHKENFFQHRRRWVIELNEIYISLVLLTISGPTTCTFYKGHELLKKLKKSILQDNKELK
jgi:hypothetical protein